jgi:SAM-dependent methyltransferase
MAYCAKNQDVLFVNEHTEANAGYYDRIYSVDDCSRYKAIYERVSEIVKEKNFKSIIDLGCGSAELSKHVSCEYLGVDFSKKAIELATTKNDNVMVMDLYDFVEADNVKLAINSNLRQNYIILEVLEHLDDLKLIEAMPRGTNIIASVPSFGDKSHLRRYTQKIIEERYRDIIRIDFIERFNWHNKWVKDNNNTVDHITLFGGIKL